MSGWSPPTGTSYLRPSSMSTGFFGLGTNWQLLVHESLHQLLGRANDDTEIMKTLQGKGYKIDPNGDSKQISDMIRKKCN
jgi:hypothetical protein